MSFPAYGGYKDSGVAWLGDVPGHWGIQRIKQNSYVKGRVGWKGLTSGEYLDDGYAYLVTGTDFRSKTISWTDCYCVEAERYEDDPFIQLRNGDLLITKDGTIGKLTLVSGLDKPACLNSGIFLVRPNNSYHTEYLYWVLSSKAFEHFCALFSTGSTIKHLYQNVFENFSFTVPPIGEQTAISTFLDRETAKIDALVAEQERLIALLKEKRQAVISRAVTKGLIPDAPMKYSGIEWLGQIPTHWDVRKLKGLTSRIGDGLHGTPEYDDNGPCYFINGTNLYEGHIRITDGTRSVSSSTADEYQIDLDQSTVLMSINGTIGNLALYRNEPIILGKSAAYINCDEEIDREFLFYVLHSDAAKRFFQSTIANTTIHNLSLDAIRSLRIGLPDMAEQKLITEEISEAIIHMHEAIGAASKAITLLQERRAALISAAVTGKIDVRGAVADLPELESA